MIYASESLLQDNKPAYLDAEHGKVCNEGSNERLRRVA